MTTSGGGWTLILKHDLSSTADQTDAGYNVAALSSPELDAVAVLARAELNAIGEVFRGEAPSAGYVIFFRDAEFYTSGNHDMSVSYALRARLPWQAGFHVGVVNRYPDQLGYSSGTAVDDTKELFAPIRFAIPRLWFANGSFANGYYSGRVWVR